jgi:hypothetical protein
MKTLTIFWILNFNDLQKILIQYISCLHNEKLLNFMASINFCITARDRTVKPLEHLQKSSEAQDEILRVRLAEKFLNFIVFASSKSCLLKLCISTAQQNMKMYE